MSVPGDKVTDGDPDVVSGRCLRGSPFRGGGDGGVCHSMSRYPKIRDGPFLGPLNIGTTSRKSVECRWTIHE